MSISFGILGLLAMVLAGITGIVLFVMLLVPTIKGLAWLISSIARGTGAVIAHLFRFVFGMIADTMRFIGALLTALIFVPLVLVNVIIGRWSASRHFGNALHDEFRAAGACLYRVLIGHPARLLLLHSVTEGIEKRIPEAMANAPGPDRPRSKRGQFEGYTIVGSLQGGGSGAKLYVAEPTDEKRASIERSHHNAIDQVVIKSFSIHEGSSLPQIVRESRSLEAARKLGLVLDHDLTAERFFYVMPYVPGDSLTTVAHRLHADSSPGGLDRDRLRNAIGYVADLVQTLEHYHRGGLWHKDVKPDNIIVSADGRAHLVDLGLVTPLRSAMTLTTHGTEYFRDPEMVRMALRGAKVHEIDGCKVDIYGAGAVLFSVIEDSFPAHGELSRITRRCPEALRWVIRRSMATMNKRYGSAGEMLADLRAIQRASDPFMLKPKDLPSVMAQGIGRGMGSGVGEPAEQFAGYDDHPPSMAEASWRAPHQHAARAGSPVVPAQHRHAPAGDAAQARDVKIKMVNWWSGAYEAQLPAAGAPANLPNPTDYFAARDAVPVVGRAGADAPRRTAAEIRQSAQLRIKERQAAAAKRRQQITGRFNTNPGPGVLTAVVLFLLFVGSLVVLFMPRSSQDEFQRNLARSFGGSELPGGVSDEPHGEDIARVLVLNDRRGTATAEEAQSLRELAERLRETGFMILGLGSDPAELELIARARTTVGNSGPYDRDALNNLRVWIDGLANDGLDLDAVLWVPATGEESLSMILHDRLEAGEKTKLIESVSGVAKGKVVVP